VGRTINNPWPIAHHDLDRLQVWKAVQFFEDFIVFPTTAVEDVLDMPDAEEVLFLIFLKNASMCIRMRRECLLDAESCLFGDEARLSCITCVVVTGSDVIIHGFVDTEHGVRVKAWIPVRLEGFSDADRILRGDYNV
jgi:hypothetical protein